MKVLRKMASPSVDPLEVLVEGLITKSPPMNRLNSRWQNRYCVLCYKMIRQSIKRKSTLKRLSSKEKRESSTYSEERKCVFCYYEKKEHVSNHEPINAHPVDTGRTLNVHKTFRRRPGRLLNVLCTFSLRPVSEFAAMNASEEFDSEYASYHSSNFEEFCIEGSRIIDIPNGVRDYKHLFKLQFSREYDNREMYLCFDNAEECRKWRDAFEKYREHKTEEEPIDFIEDDTPGEDKSSILLKDEDNPLLKQIEDLQISIRQEELSKFSNGNESGYSTRTNSETQSQAASLYVNVSTPNYVNVSRRPYSSETFRPMQHDDNTCRFSAPGSMSKYEDNKSP